MTTGIGLGEVTLKGPIVVNGIYPEIVDHERVAATLKNPPIFVNDIDTSTLAGREYMDSLIYTKYDGGGLSILPSCECGNPEYTGTAKQGLICPECNTVVVPSTERPIESNVWIRAPEGVHALINPQMWIILGNAFTLNGCNLLEWLINPAGAKNTNNNAKLEILKQYKFPHGINSLFENFDDIMSALLDRSIVNGSTRRRAELKQFIDLNRDRIFTKILPIPNKLMFITEKAVTTTYADQRMASALDAVHTIEELYSTTTTPSLRKRELASARCVIQLAQYYHAQYKDIIGGKYGWARKHLFGTRQAYSFRAVISSLSARHRYDELHLPWGLSIALFRVHLTNKLLRRGLTSNEIAKFLYEHTSRYHPLLDELFKEIIAGHPRGLGFPTFFLRNPTLDRLSGQRFYITQVKPDVNVKTVSLSLLVISHMNADFDGDALGGMLILDDETLVSADRLAAHTGVLDLEKARTISGKISLPGPVVATYANWMHEIPENEDAEAFKQLLIDS